MAQYLQEKMVDVTSTSESMTHLRKLILASDILVTFIGVDETYWSCREKGKIKGPPEDEPGRKSHRSKSKTLRSYVFGIVSKKVCLYYHSLERSADIPKNIILDNQVSADCFIDDQQQKRINQAQVLPQLCTKPPINNNFSHYHWLRGKINEL